MSEITPPVLPAVPPLISPERPHGIGRL